MGEPARSAAAGQEATPVWHPAHAFAPAGLQADGAPMPSSTTGAAGAGSQGDGHSAELPAWLLGLEADARQRLDAGQADVWDSLSRCFETQLISTALEVTRGRRIEAAQKLGIGRNTITRKIQDLGLED
jgi:two-component system nitrogen regulation response regulator GlnG